jgi:adenosylmethionine-8-amino-7-oxononanoate aminotransferase
MMTTKEIQELRKWDQEHIAHPAYRVGGELTWVVDKAKGRATVIDIEGNEYLDGASQLICVNLGYGRTEIIEAMKEQMDRIPYYPQQYGVSNLTTIKCAQKLAELTPEGLDHFFFTSGGGDSNETLFRLARRYWNVKGTNKYKIISLYEGYHGTSLGAITATGVMKGALRKRPSPPPAGFLHIPAPYCYRCPFGKEYPECGIQCAQYLAYVIESEDPETVAAFIAEPVLGVAGMVVPPPEYWPMVRKICNEHDVLLIADEIITGFCRTGKLGSQTGHDGSG